MSSPPPCPSLFLPSAFCTLSSRRRRGTTSTRILNLNSTPTLQRQTQCRIELSDHSILSAAPTMGASSVSNGAVVVLAVFAVGLVVFPDPVAEYVRGEQNGKDSFWTLANLLRIAHVTSFATIFGMQFWVSFIGGVIMFKNLPRHQFGNLQSHMFPIYFKLAAVCLACNISILSVLHPLASPTLWETLQIGALGLSLVFTLTNLLVLEPLTTKMMRERHKAEKEDGISTEPGVNRKKEIEKASPKLRAINKKFGALHGISSLINLFAFWGLLVHVAYLAGRLSL